MGIEVLKKEDNDEEYKYKERLCIVLQDQSMTDTKNKKVYKHSRPIIDGTQQYSNDIFENYIRKHWQSFYEKNYKIFENLYVEKLKIKNMSDNKIKLLKIFFDENYIDDKKTFFKSISIMNKEEFLRSQDYINKKKFFETNNIFKNAEDIYLDYFCENSNDYDELLYEKMLYFKELYCYQMFDNIFDKEKLEKNKNKNYKDIICDKLDKPIINNTMEYTNEILENWLKKYDYKDYEDYRNQKIITDENKKKFKIIKDKEKEERKSNVSILSDYVRKKNKKYQRIYQI